MLSEKTKEVVKSTYPVLQEHGVAITTRMYERLFDEHPIIRIAKLPIAFSSDMAWASS